MNYLRPAFELRQRFHYTNTVRQNMFSPCFLTFDLL